MIAQAGIIVAKLCWNRIRGIAVIIGAVTHFVRDPFIPDATAPGCTLSLRLVRSNHFMS
jgi:hypothetical protein